MNRNNPSSWLRRLESRSDSVLMSSWLHHDTWLKQMEALDKDFKPVNLKPDQSGSAKLYNRKMQRYNYRKRRDELWAAFFIDQGTRPLVVPIKPTNPQGKGWERYQVALEKYRRKMRARGLEPVV